MTLPKLSIAAKLYAIFALMATTTVGLSMVAVHGARSHAALIKAFKSANAGSWHLERINGLLYAATVEAHAITMAGNRHDAEAHAKAMVEADDRLGSTLSNWQLSVTDSDAAEFSRLSALISDFRDFVPQLARVASE